MEASIEKDSNLNQDTMAGEENYSKYFDWIMYSTEFTVDVIIRTSLALTQHINYNYFTDEIDSLLRVRSTQDHETCGAKARASNSALRASFFRYHQCV